MTVPFLPARAARRRRGDTKTYDALWSAAGWEAEAERVLRERPNCMSATYREDEEEKHLRAAARKRKVTLIPYLNAGPELVLDLSARQRVQEYLRRAEEALAGDDAVLLVVAEEDRHRSGTAPRAPAHRVLKNTISAWPRARRGAWA